MNGTIVTFYSYKGGTGRSMSLANTAWILASNGLRVLVLDWDLEAPGLHRFFHPFLPDRELRTSEGVIELMWAFAEAAMDPEAPDTPGWHEEYARISPYAMSVKYAFPGRGTVDLVPCGRQDAAYAGLVSSFDWDNFYDRLGGGGFLEALKRDMRQRYDYVLIDSRTGLSDTASICTIQLPDILVDCFTFSTQAIDGAAAVAASADQQRCDDSLRILPVPMRVEDAERDMLDAGRDYARAKFGRFLSHIADPESYWGEVEIPYKTFYAYEEILATIGDRPRLENTVLAATERFVGHLTDGRVSALRSSLSEFDRRGLLQLFRRDLPEAEAEGLPLRRVTEGSPRVLIAQPAGRTSRGSRGARELWHLLRSNGLDARMLQVPMRGDIDRSAVEDEVYTADLVVAVESPTDAAGDEGTPSATHEPATVTLDRLVSLAAGRLIRVVLPLTLTGALTTEETLRESDVVVMEGMDTAEIEPIIRRATELHAERARALRGEADTDDVVGWRGRQIGSDVASAAINHLADRLSLSLLDPGEQSFISGPRLRGASLLPVPWHASALVAAGSGGGPRAVAGSVTDLSTAFMSTFNFRLILLGGPGAGKTTALLELQRGLMLDRRLSMPLLPVLLPAATWRLEEEGLLAWTERRLREEYLSALSGFADSSHAARLVESRAVIPIIDGLDELTEAERLVALIALARVGTDQPYVVSCRTAEFSLSLQASGLVLPDVSVIELGPLTAPDVSGYLLGTREGTQRWQPVVAEVARGGPLAVTLANPLMLELARTLYSDPSTDPSELLALEGSEVEARLLGQLIVRAYAGTSERDLRRVPYEPALSWRRLSFLAWHLESEGTDELAWWRLHRVLPSSVARALLALCGGSLVGLLAFLCWMVRGGHAHSAVSVTLAGGGVGLLTSLLAVVTSNPEALPAVSLGWRRLFRLGPVPLRFTQTSMPDGLLRQDRNAMVLRWWTTAVLSLPLPVLPVVVLARSAANLSFAVTAWIVGIGLLCFGRSAWGWFSLTRLTLFVSRRAPFRFMAFVDDAWARGVLRRRGAAYAFRHQALQRYLASWPSPPFR